MNQSGVVFVRADASESIGIGHIRRCAILAAELSKHGYGVVLVTRTRPEAKGVALGWPYQVVQLDGRCHPHTNEELSDAEKTQAVIQHHGAGRSWVIVDGERFGYDWERFLRQSGHMILAFDDSRSRRHCADIVVSDSEKPFDGALLPGSEPTQRLSGRQYALIDERFKPVEDTVTRARREKKTILITYGGSDPTGETLKAMQAVAWFQRVSTRSHRIGQIDIVVGPLNCDAVAITAEARGVSSAKIHCAPACLAPLMQSADIVLTAGGNSMVEALVMGKLCLVTVTAANQQQTVSELACDAAVRLLGHHSQVTSEDIVNEIADAIDHFDTLSRLMAQRQLYDHHGARRIAEAMALSLVGA